MTANGPRTHGFGLRERCLLFFCLINFTTGALYVWSIFAAALAGRLSTLAGAAVTPGELAPVFGVASAMTPFMMIAGGFVNDRFGPKPVISAGGLLIGLGYWGACAAGDVAGLMLSYGLLVGVGTGLVNGCTINTAVKFFPDRRGFAGGLVTASLGLGAAALPFAAKAAIELLGIDGALVLFGLVSAAVITPLGLLTKKPAAEGMEARAAAVGAVPRPSATPREMIASPVFIPLALLFMTAASMGLMLISSASSIGMSQVGLDAAAAAGALSVLSLANTAGRFVSGVASDRFGRLPTLTAMLVVALAGLAALWTAGRGDALLFFVGLAGVGLCFGSFIGVYPGLVADEFGPKYNSVNFSILMLGYSVGGIAGTWLIKATAASGSFSGAYLTAMALAAAGIGFAFMTRRRAGAPAAASC